MTNFAIKRAIVSVWNKEKVVPLAKKLEEHGVEIFSTGGTFRKLKEAGIDVNRVTEITEYPEILDGRVKTLHPLIFGGLLADTSKEEHKKDLEQIGASPFQLVVVNLYPFSQAYNDPESTHDEIIEMIDIGGPSMLRAAAKNYSSNIVLSEPEQYDRFLAKLEKDALDLEYRKKLAAAVFQKTYEYDRQIVNYFADINQEEILAEGLYKKVHDLRYGENPDQKAGLYAPQKDLSWRPFQQLGGKELSYNNYQDCLAAYQIVQDMQFDEPACALIKHMNPCGFGTGSDLKKAYLRAVKTDPKSYYGGIVSLNGKVTKELAEEMIKSFLECIIAPEYDPKALEVLKSKKNLRILIPDDDGLNMEQQVHTYGQGKLVQDQQKISEAEEQDWKIVTENKNTKNYQKALQIGWRLIKNVKSNAIVLADENGAVGVGAGQMSRVDALKIAIRKAGEAGLNLDDTIMASDAFFPFRDSVDLAQEEGIVGVIQPGGSIRDEEVITACDEHDMFMIFTGKRVFKH
ncbi:MAG TPA: bifunctional phosphoribosylaminoimidazolecarboxamide formyltransferase/IMP cyclohydrolase [bacterium]|nr:bifunctional phosphoribosylaminoimidazolecarboxamide formyltransferase/IMP cyclohydrolase [bacterium]